MKFRCSAFAIAALAISALAAAQQPSQSPQQSGGQGQGMGQGRRGGGRMVEGMGRGIGGTVTAVAAGSLTVKTETGESYTVHFSANTRFMKQPPQPANAGQQGNDNQPGAAATRGGGNGGRDGFGGQGGRRMDPPIAIKATDIKVGDSVMVGGEVDDAGKSVGAVMVMQLDPERAREMRQLQANFGKTWLIGRVTAINETKVTIESNVDNASHAFVADENTTFRKRRDPVTLADIQPGDTVRVEGAIKGGTFVATSVSVMGGGQRPQQ